MVRMAEEIEKLKEEVDALKQEHSRWEVLVLIFVHQDFGVIFLVVHMGFNIFYYVILSLFLDAYRRRKKRTPAKRM